MEYTCLEDVTLIRSTEKAGLFDIDGEEIWIPWSCIEENEGDVCHDHEQGTIHVVNWFVEKEGLV